MRARNFKDETGNQYGRLTVLEFSGVIKGKSTWKCKCACGNECIVTRINYGLGQQKVAVVCNVNTAKTVISTERTECQKRTFMFCGCT